MPARTDRVRASDARLHQGDETHPGGEPTRFDVRDMLALHSRTTDRCRDDDVTLVNEAVGDEYLDDVLWANAVHRYQP
jgi:hypothetical protein